MNGETFPSLMPLREPCKFALTVECDGHGSLFVLPVSDLRHPDRCEQVLRMVMLACGIDPDTLAGPEIPPESDAMHPCID